MADEDEEDGLVSFQIICQQSGRVLELARSLDGANIEAMVLFGRYELCIVQTRFLDGSKFVRRSGRGAGAERANPLSVGKHRSLGAADVELGDLEPEGVAEHKLWCKRVPAKGEFRIPVPKH
jgi:hypothetical protein